MNIAMFGIIALLVSLVASSLLVWYVVRPACNKYLGNSPTLSSQLALILYTAVLCYCLFNLICTVVGGLLLF